TSSSEGVADIADYEPAAARDAAHLSELDVVDLPPPGEVGVVVVEASLYVAVPEGQRADVDQHRPRPTMVRVLREHVGPRRPAVVADVDVRVVGQRPVVLVELDRCR